MLASRLLGVAHLQSADPLALECVGDLRDLFGSSSLVYCRITAKVDQGPIHAYLASCGNVVQRRFDIGILQCSSQDIQRAASQGYRLDVATEKSIRKLDRRSLHGLYQAFNTAGASVIISVPILDNSIGPCHPNEEVLGFLTLAWKLHPTQALSYLPSMKALAAEMSSGFTACMKPIVNDVIESFLPPLGRLSLTRRPGTLGTQGTGTLCRDKGPGDPDDDTAPSSCRATISTPLKAGGSCVVQSGLQKKNKRPFRHITANEKMTFSAQTRRPHCKELESIQMVANPVACRVEQKEGIFSEDEAKVLPPSSSSSTTSSSLYFFSKELAAHRAYRRSPARDSSATGTFAFDAPVLQCARDVATTSQRSAPGSGAGLESFLKASCEMHVSRHTPPECCYCNLVLVFTPTRPQPPVVVLVLLLYTRHLL
eukprot:jgi/Botrbrau1/13147/Bobra.0187s0095.1